MWGFLNTISKSNLDLTAQVLKVLKNIEIIKAKLLVGLLKIPWPIMLGSWSSSNFAYINQCGGGLAWVGPMND